MNDYSMHREKTEWMNMWYSQANMECERCLLIGDSVTRALRSKLNFFVKEWMGVDLYAASFSITDELFWKGLHCFLSAEEYKYKKIILNYGFHHGFSVECCNNPKDYNEFNRAYKRLVEYCLNICADVVIVSGTSFVKKDNLKEIDIVKEKEILVRNNIAKSVAEQKGCVFLTCILL